MRNIQWQNKLSIWNYRHRNIGVLQQRSHHGIITRKSTTGGGLNYSWLSLSRPRLSRTIAYLEAIIWSLHKHENLTTGNKILWKREQIAPKEQFSSFHNIFNIPLTSGVNLHIHLLNVAVRFIYPKFCKSDMSMYGYLEVFQRVPWNSR